MGKAQGRARERERERRTMNRNRGNDAGGAMARRVCHAR